MIQSAENSLETAPFHRVLYAGSSVEFTCSSKTMPVWLKNGELIKKVYFYGILLFENLTRGDSGNYTCLGVDVYNWTRSIATWTLYVVGLLKTQRHLSSFIYS